MQGSAHHRRGVGIRAGDLGGDDDEDRDGGGDYHCGAPQGGHGQDEGAGPASHGTVLIDDASVHGGGHRQEMEEGGELREQGPATVGPRRHELGGLLGIQQQEQLRQPGRHRIPLAVAFSAVSGVDHDRQDDVAAAAPCSLDHHGFRLRGAGALSLEWRWCDLQNRRGGPARL